MSTTARKRHRILFVAEGVTLAHVIRPLVLAKTLDPERYEIHFACAPGYERFFRDTSFTLWPLRSISGQDYLQAIGRGAPPYSEQTLLGYVDEELRILDQIRPQLVVGDNRRSLAISAPVSQIPYAALTNAHWSPYSTIPRFPVPDHPLVNRFGLSITSLLAWCIRPAVFAAYARPVNRLRRRHGLPPLGSLSHVLTAGDFTLYVDTPGLSPTAHLPASHRYIGPLLASPEMMLPDWWDSLPRERPRIYVSLGSSGPVHLLPVLIEALAGLPATVLVATAGRLRLDSLPANVRAVDYLPGLLAARQSSLVICNGGTGAVYQALAAGVPVLGIASNMDQYLTMTCVTRANAGLLLRAGTTRCQEIRLAAMRLLEHPDFGAAARVLAEEIRRYDSEEEFHRFVDHLLGHPTR